jgi:Cns1/TTC4 Wheel domain
MTLVIPVFFLYPQYATSDLISHYAETVPFSTHLDDMFPPSNTENIERRPAWDKQWEYLAPDLVVYAITHKKRLLKVGKKMNLLALCNASEGKHGQPDGLEVKNGCLSVVVLPKGEVERRWIEEFKATR